MTKNRYCVTGIITNGGTPFYGECIAYDIISAIQLFKDNGFSVYTVQSRTQVNANKAVCIENIRELYFDRYKIYKSIMSRKPEAINEINSLDEAKEIISMIAGDITPKGEIYQTISKEMEDKYKSYKDSRYNSLTIV